MTRSKRRTPVIGITTARSDKPFKVSEHRAERRKTRVVVKRSEDGDDPRLHGAPYGNPYSAPKDGKQMVDPKSRWMLK